MKLTKLALAAGVLSLGISTAHAQTYKTDFSTQVTLAGSGTNTAQTISLKAGTPATSFSYTFPASIPNNPAGYFLTTGTDGGLSWSNASSSINLTQSHFFVGNASGLATDVPMYGDASLTYDAANGGVIAITTTAGNDIVGALNAVATTDNISNTSISVTAGAITGSSLTTLGAVDGGTGVFTSTLSADGLTSTGGLTSGGAASDLNNADADAVNIGDGTSEANAIGIGNGDGSSGTYSTTTFAGLVNFTGTVSIPSGSLDLGLATNNLYLGDGSNVAAPLAPTASSVLVTSTDGGVSWGTTLPTGLTINNATIGGTTSVNTTGNITTTGSGSLTVAGQTTLASTALSNGTVAAATTIALDGLHSYYSLTGSTAVAIGAITGAPAGQILVFVNTGTANFTLTGAGLLGAGTGDVIMTPGGSATLIYDGSNWHLLASN